MGQTMLHAMTDYWLKIKQTAEGLRKRAHHLLPPSAVVWPIAILVPLLISRPWAVAFFILALAYGWARKQGSSPVERSRSVEAALGATAVYMIGRQIVAWCAVRGAGGHDLGEVVLCFAALGIFYALSCVSFQRTRGFERLIEELCWIALAMIVLFECAPQIFSFFHSLFHHRDVSGRWKGFRKTALSEWSLLALLVLMAAWGKWWQEGKGWKAVRSWRGGGRVLLFVMAVIVNVWVSSFTSLLALLGGVAIGIGYTFMPRCVSWGMIALGNGTLFFLPLVKSSLLHVNQWASFLPQGVSKDLFLRLHGLHVRFLVWDIALGAIKTHFWFGMGKAAAKELLRSTYVIKAGLTPLHIHNYVLQLWMESGLVGIALIAALWSVCIRAVHKSARALPWEKGVALSFFMYTFIMGQAAFECWKTWWICWVGIVLVIWKLWAKEAPEGSEGCASGVNVPRGTKEWV